MQCSRKMQEWAPELVAHRFSGKERKEYLLSKNGALRGQKRSTELISFSAKIRAVIRKLQLNNVGVLVRIERTRVVAVQYLPHGHRQRQTHS